MGVPLILLYIETPGITHPEFHIKTELLDF